MSAQNGLEDPANTSLEAMPAVQKDHRTLGKVTPRPRITRAGGGAGRAKSVVVDSVNDSLNESMDLEIA